MTTPEKRLEELGLALPPAPDAVAAYVPLARHDGWSFVSGQLPFVDGKLAATGRVGKDVTLEEAHTLARTCAINALAVIRKNLGSLDAVERIVRVGVFVASADDFYDQPLVANGASELFEEVFGEAGRHARAAVGVNVLPLNAPVEVEVTLR